ncbi:MAG: phosphate transport system regulatory protein PhoU [Rickettsiales bacterium]|nr:phosphate transport system regulatory protein PhoU [Rickettsiales bacterium]
MKDKQHIVSNYDNDLNDLKNMVIEMGVLVEKQLFNAVEFIKTFDEDKVSDFEGNEKNINKYETRVREHGTKTLSKRQPLADDLRLIIIGIKLSSTLERIGDHSHNIVRRVLSENINPNNYETDTVYRLGTNVLKNVSQALTAYDLFSQEIALTIPEEDKKIDLFYENCFREHLNIMIKNPKNIGFITQRLFIAKELERIGDLGKNISKEVLYYTSGKLL